jgi:DNA-binding transcriptional LysR family regulator
VPSLASLKDSHPGIAVELITDTRSLSLARREADVAIRLAPFEQHDAVVSRIADMAFGLYASDAYLSAHGTPDFTSGAVGHRIITLQDDLGDVPEARWLRAIAEEAARVLLANSRDVQLQACMAAVGLAALPRYLADGITGLHRLDTAPAPPTRGIWLGVHKDMRRAPRIRAVLDVLTAGVRTHSQKLAPRD